MNSTSFKPTTTQIPQQEIHFCTAPDGVRIAYALAGSGPPLVKTANWLNHLEYDWESPIWSQSEGIVSKKLNAPYRSGPSRTWVKVKNPKAPAATRALDGTFWTPERRASQPSY